MRRVVAVPVLAVAAVLAGCGSSAADDFADSLRKAGFTNVEVHEDKESRSVDRKKKKKSVVVGYDFVWKANTDGDAATCEVELEHAASGSGKLTGGGWYIDEVNGKDVDDSPASPNPDAVRAYLTSHRFDC